MASSAKRRIPRYLPDDEPKSPPADPCQLWPRSLWPLIDFLIYGGTGLPLAPFELAQGSRVTNPAAWLECLWRDVMRGPRARWGALQEDLYQLHQLFGRLTFSRDTISAVITAARPPPKPR